MSTTTPSYRKNPAVKTWLLITLVSSLAGCAANPGQPVSDVQAELISINPTPLQRIDTDEQQQQINQRVQQLLSAPLTLDSAVEIAVLNNKAIQAELFALGVAAAQLQQATQLPNPAITLTRSTSGDGYATELEFGINLLSLLTLPTVRQLENHQFAEAKLQTAQRIASIIADTHLAYWNAVAAQEVLHYTGQVYTTTSAGAELAKRMLQAGNFNKLAYLREQSLLTEATLNLVKARHTAYRSKETLQNLLGVWQDSSLVSLPERLPEIPAQQPDWREIADIGLSQRLDIRLAKLQLQRIAQQAGLTQASRFINAFELEVGTNLDDSSERSYAAVLELPLFDWGAYRVKKAEYQYKQAFNQAFVTGINARSALRQHYVNYQSAHELAQHYQHAVLPIQQQIAEENQLRYNGMFISVFELIADARNQVAAVTGFVNASRDFWLAKSQLDFALLGVPVTAVAASEAPAIKADTAAGH